MEAFFQLELLISELKNTNNIPPDKWALIQECLAVTEKDLRDQNRHVTEMWVEVRRLESKNKVLKFSQNQDHHEIESLQTDLRNARSAEPQMAQRLIHLNRLYNEEQVKTGQLEEKIKHLEALMASQIKSSSTPTIGQSPSTPWLSTQSLTSGAVAPTTTSVRQAFCYFDIKTRLMRNKIYHSFYSVFFENDSKFIRCVAYRVRDHLS
jgi:hypothetical protein